MLDREVEEGNQLIVRGDFNLEYEELSNWILDVSLANLTPEIHGSRPRAYNTTKHESIDGSFDSPCFNISKGGYLSFGRLQINHLRIWLDISTH